MTAFRIQGDPAAVSLRAGADLAADVRRGLGASSKFLPPKYFYDRRGLEIFERICALPEYYLTRAETALLKERAGRIVRSVRPRELVELGPGTADKAEVLLGAMEEAGPPERYICLDVSPTGVRQVARDLSRRFPELDILGIVGDIARDLPAVPAGDRRIVALLGSTIGNFAREAEARFLESAREMLGVESAFLLGVDLVKDTAVLEAAYNDSEGLTAEFNRNVLRVINKRLGGNLDPDLFAHVAAFDPSTSAVESYLEARRSHTARIEALDMDVRFEQGERIHTETSRKYTRGSVERALTAARLRLEQWHADDRGAFALALAVRAAGGP